MYWTCRWIHNMVNDMKRFVYYPMSQMITDNLTGKRYVGNQKTCDLMNDLDDWGNSNAERYFAFLTVLDKYGIGSVEKLDKVLFEQRLW